ncbi:DUF3168 domain-containing protein [Comamonas sp. C11]|uniref:tail completion protein gp17 n=1 Tax=Comamonas sp. C11 TaxID=2966554 RepID=UPI002112ECCD|nr:DUF3168 domain-containing protein [Comamonas sp. C11]UUC92463.1 DUF3168 domain-containing protein [Comamonas sp. C11]UUC92515.1 DUF3168 domain-containing protein [Comamonas sp. C11]
MDEVLHEAIAAVIPNCFGTVAPANAPTPYVIWQRFGGNSSEYLDNEDAQVETALVQVRIFSTDIQDPKRLMPQLVSALRSHPELVIRPSGGMRDDYDHDMGLFSGDQDLDVSF